MNRHGSPGWQADMQRHHVLPVQLLHLPAFAAMFACIGRPHLRFDDFRSNGLLLPATVTAARRTGMPLHRGPHRHYNELAAERVGQIEGHWRRSHMRQPDMARYEALMRLDLLQRALKRRLLQHGARRFVLNRKDPFRAGLDFSLLDALVEQLWQASGAALSDSSFEQGQFLLERPQPVFGTV
ncbi:AHH domain-containing protein [Erythrobacter sp. EC-HK427]|uniref:AHH domain-containing protein n=1 Tax=Erythrobacter sp. EC-HK427 TaxID=2038396 RepID=UPI0021071DEE|nr:AHH domain-containing protein [Erythrobacter sp. EC-HK427]